METLFVYLGKSSGLIALFYLAYYLILQKETFFISNRWFLLAGLITSTLLPLLFFTKIIWVNPSPTNLNWSKVSVTTPIENESIEINWYLIFGIVYGIGIVLFLLKLVFDLYSLSKIIKGKKIQKQANFKFIDVTESISPFSYLNYIVYNSSLYSESELENILEHEKVHSSQVHTADVLISRLFCIAFWFNPFVWLYKKAIDQNLEFIADSEASKNSSDKKAYQLTLLKITTQENCVALTNHFYQSLIKKRIVMLNKNQSKKRNSWKYAFVLPLLGAFVFFFQVKIVAQEISSKNTTKNKSEIIITIDKNFSDKELKKETELFKKVYDCDLIFSEIERNSDNEIIGITVNYNKDIYGNGTYKQHSKNTIESFYIKRDVSNKINISNASLDKKLNENKTKDNEIKIPLDEEILTENALKPEDAIKKYGKEGKNSAVEISTINSEEKIKGFEKKMKLHNKDFENLNKRQEADTLSFDKNLASFEKDIAVFDKDMESLDKIEKENNKSREVKINKVKVNKLKYSEQAKADAVQAKTDAKQAKKDAIQAKIDRVQAKKDSEQAKADAVQAKTDAKQAKKDAIQAKIDRDHAKKDSEQAKTDVLQIKIESKPIIIINGKRTEASMEDINKLDPNLIQSMNILKGKNTTEKYGKNGKNGAIEIITKENVDILKSSNKKVK